MTRQNKNINLEKLMQAQFDSAKFWLMLATVCGVGIVLIDIFVIFSNQLSKVLAMVVAILIILNAVFVWWSDKLREHAETILRKFETYNSLGWGINAREIANILAESSNTVKQAARSAEEYIYFTSEENKSPKKLLENLEESAWWSKNLARRMAKYVGTFGIAVMSLSFLSLVIALQSSLPSATSDSIAKIIISIIVFMFSGGYIRMAFDYNSFANQANKTEEAAFRLQTENEISDIDAIKLLHDYQIDRATSPLLPSWLWKVMNKELNELWVERIESENR